MSGFYESEPLLDLFILETSQQLEQLEQLILLSEQADEFANISVKEIFRIMHNIKGSSAMMLFKNIASLAHSMEDLFYFIRESKEQEINCPLICELVFLGIDFIKVEMEKIKNKDETDGDPKEIITKIQLILNEFKVNTDIRPTDSESSTGSNQKYYISQAKPLVKVIKNYEAIVFFDDGCEMENVRAYTIIHNLKDKASELVYFPDNIIEDDKTVEIIRREGFKLQFNSSMSLDEVKQFFDTVIFLKDLKIKELTSEDIKLKEVEEIKQLQTQTKDKPLEDTLGSNYKGLVSVNLTKLDKLMDLIGELVIAESIVTQNPDLKDLNLDNFKKSARHLRKIINEVQDTVMSIRMVPLDMTFHKMHRIVRDMCKNLNKEVNLEIAGEETEVDKNIIEQISDPLMHLVRNAIDHGIETTDDRIAKGKAKSGRVKLEAKNAGSEVIITISDDGGGLNKDKIINKAKMNNLLQKDESELTDKEIYGLILLPGFSTKENVTEYSGRGVGLDVVARTIENVGGVVSIDSKEGIGTTITLRIPLTLAIIDGMNIKVGKSRFTIPTTSIKESFRITDNDLIIDPDGNEMLMIRGKCLPVLRLNNFYHLYTDVKRMEEGIITIIESDRGALCIFSDELLGEQQIVVKPLPDYIKNTKKANGLAGCTLLGDGSISLILDVNGLIIHK